MVCVSAATIGSSPRRSASAAPAAIARPGFSRTASKDSGLRAEVRELLGDQETRLAEFARGDAAFEDKVVID